jgi:hypothetical protein
MSEDTAAVASVGIRCRADPQAEPDGPRYTSYPTADRFHGGYGIAAYRLPSAA